MYLFTGYNSSNQCSKTTVLTWFFIPMFARVYPIFHQRKHFIAKIYHLIYMLLVWSLKFTLVIFNYKVRHIYINGYTNDSFNDDEPHLLKRLPVLSITYNMSRKLYHSVYFTRLSPYLLKTTKEVEIISLKLNPSPCFSKKRRIAFKRLHEVL